MIGFDVDTLELPRTEGRLRAAGFGLESFTVVRSNFAGLAQVLASLNVPGVDMVLADLGVSSMQLDNPERGFTYKRLGPLDMRMNPSHGESASKLLSHIPEAKLATMLTIARVTNTVKPTCVGIRPPMTVSPLPTGSVYDAQAFITCFQVSLL